MQYYAIPSENLDTERQLRSGSRATRTYLPRRNQMMRIGEKLGRMTRRNLLQAGAGFAGGAMLPSVLTMPSFAVGVSDKPPIGTWPAGSEGETVTVGAAVPRTGTYAVQGEDELKGWQL